MTYECSHNGDGSYGSALDDMNTILDPNDLRHELRWPREVLVGELDRRIQSASRYTEQNNNWHGQIERLLRSAFRDSTIATDFASALTSHDVLFGGKFLSEHGAAWIGQLRDELQHFPEFPSVRRYYSQRHARSNKQVISKEETARRFVLVAHELVDAGFWAEHFGIACPDGIGDPLVTPNDQLGRLLGRHIDSDYLWPLNDQRVNQWSLDDFFDFIEVLHDLASWPGTWDGHYYGGCIGHPGSFSQSCGQAIYRWKVNEVLRDSDLGVYIAEDGEDRGRIVVTVPQSAEIIIESAFAVPIVSHQDDINHAIALFRSRSRDAPTLRSAVVTLAGVLEAHRQQLRSELLRNDEAALFDIANNFDLRHRDAKQKTDYDPLFLEWLFQWYLSTINLVAALIKRQIKNLS